MNDPLFQNQLGKQRLSQWLKTSKTKVYSPISQDVCPLLVEEWDHDE